MVIIETKYLGATNTRGARIKAMARGSSVTIGYDYSGDAEQVHCKAAKALAKKMGWKGLVVQADESRSGKGFLFVVS